MTQQSVAGQTLPEPMEDQAGSEQQCRVCASDGAGRHYGSVCCSGCKGFFRRSVRFQKVYQCPYGQQCAISKMYRNCCRACRFQKCLRVGMDPNLVHGDWGRSFGSDSVLARPSSSLRTCSAQVQEGDQSPCPSDALPNPPSADSPPQNPSPVDVIPLLQHNRLLNADQSQIALGIGKGNIYAPTSGDCTALANYFVAVERFCDMFVDCPSSPSAGSPFDPVHPKDYLPAVSLDVPVEVALKQPGKVSPRFPISWSPNHHICKEMLQRVYCRVMVHYFDWASHVPELAVLSEEDRQTLVAKRAIRCVWLLCAFRSASHPSANGIMGGSEMFFPYAPEEQSRLDPELKEMFLDSTTLAFNELVLPFRELRLSESEYALLRALCLFAPVSHLSEQGRVQVVKAQNKYLNALGELVRQRQDESQMDAMARMGRLMMFLATTEQVAQMDDNAFAMMNVFNLAEMRGALTYDIHIRALEEQQQRTG